MQTIIHKHLKNHPAIHQADKILRSCVHCGFCNATCPTYQLLGDELDGPRGRIYLIKQLIETNTCSAQTRLHLDRCLTCRNCETTCPSGVEYSQLLALGRELAEEKTTRPAFDRALRYLLRLFIPYRKRIGLLVNIAQKLKPVLPVSIRRQLPAKDLEKPALSHHSRRVILPAGCAQSAFAADINADCQSILDALGITTIETDTDTCCGALSDHLSEKQQTELLMKTNIDAWWPEIEAGAEAIISTASACGLMIKDYGRLLADDPDYADKAKRVSQSCLDISEFLDKEDLSQLPVKQCGKVSFHSPCTLQHGQKITGKVEAILARAGFELADYDDAHLCCGSAGSYSLLQPALSQQLLQNKIARLSAAQPDIIATANIGCLLHMRSKTSTPVRHWLQLLKPDQD